MSESAGVSDMSEYRKLAREIAERSIVTDAVARLIEQIVSEVKQAGMKDAPAPEVPKKWNPDQKWLYDGLIRKARSDALEEAAKWYDHNFGDGDGVAAAIRALKEKP